MFDIAIGTFSSVKGSYLQMQGRVKRKRNRRKPSKPCSCGRLVPVSVIECASCGNVFPESSYIPYTLPDLK